MASKSKDCASPLLRRNLDALGEALGSAMAADLKEFRDKPIGHKKRNKSGHRFKPDGSGRPASADPQGIAQKCTCGLTLFEWRCKWFWG